MECAARGRVATRCVQGPPTRRCARCGAVAYCSLSHQISHWNLHKGECTRFAKQMINADVLNDFPFTFSKETNFQSESADSKTRCLLSSEGLHRKGLWKFECCSESSIVSSEDSWVNNEWNLPSALCPCTEPRNPISACLSSWKDYYLWRCLPFHSPVALLLHWPLTLYHCFQLIYSCIPVQVGSKLYIHYLGPDKELLELAAFGELLALFPGAQLHIEFVGPSVPELRDGDRISLHNYACCSEDDCSCRTSLDCSSRGASNASSSVTIQLWKGFYHDRYGDMLKVSPPQFIIAPNAGLAAYSSWLPTVELIQRIGVPAIFSDFCEEAAQLAARCVETVTGQPPRLPVQVNPFRQPMRVEDSVLFIPCYSNCYIFGM